MSMNSSVLGGVVGVVGWLAAVIGIALYERGPIARQLGLLVIALGIAMVLGGLGLMFL